MIPKSFKEKSYAFSGNIDQKIPGFSLKLLPLKQLTEYIDPSYIPEVYGGKAKEFPNLLSGINKKPSNDDFMIDFENLIKEMQFLEIEREKKVF